MIFIFFADWKRQVPGLWPKLRWLVLQGGVCSCGRVQQAVLSTHQGGGQTGGHRGPDLLDMVRCRPTRLQLRGQFIKGGMVTVLSILFIMLWERERKIIFNTKLILLGKNCPLYDMKKKYVTCYHIILKFSSYRY